MSRRHWIAAVAFGLAILTGGNSQIHAQRQQPNSSKQQASSVRPPASFKEALNEIRIRAFEYESPCYEAKHGPESDLCQQWRMANAAEKQVYWTRIESIVATFAIGGLIATIIYTHITLRLNIVTTRRQLRAYVSVVGSNSMENPDDGTISFVVAIKNSGQTPAYDMDAGLGNKLTEKPLTRELSPPKGAHSVRGTTTLGVGAHDEMRTRSVPLSADDRAAIARNEKAIYVIGRVKYRDIWGDDQITNVRLVYEGHPGGMRRDKPGNDAS